MEYVAELKVDGLSMALHYEQGRFARGGDARQRRARRRRHPERARHPAVPLVLSGAGVPAELEVRGEVFFPRSRFEAMNREREERG